MTSLEFRSKMLEKLRAFENWAWRDSRANPDDYAQYEYEDWYELFITYMENNSEV